VVSSAGALREGPAVAELPCALREGPAVAELPCALREGPAVAELPCALQEGPAVAELPCALREGPPGCWVTGQPCLDRHPAPAVPGPRHAQQHRAPF